MLSGKHMGGKMPDVDAFIVELFSIRARLLRKIEFLTRVQREVATAPQVIVLHAAVHDIDCAIKAYRTSYANRT